MTRMRAMQLDAPGQPLRPVEREMPEPGPGELLVEISACGVCRTDLHIVDGELRGPLPVVPGHEIVGRVAAAGEGAEGFAAGDRVGIPWLGRTCGVCFFCRSGRENLCDSPLFTGFSRDGGYASHTLADAAYCFAVPDAFGDVEAAPLLCAGLIGWRALKAAREAEIGRASCRERV
jgi:propanol-preferring alcohol dehydrogenase